MIPDHISSHADDAVPTNGFSRRGFLRAGAAAGGGLMLSLRLPFAGGQAGAVDADGFMPNAFIRIDGDGQIILTMPYVEMGQGTYTAIPMFRLQQSAGMSIRRPVERRAARYFIRRAAGGSNTAIWPPKPPACRSPKTWR